MQPQQTTLSGSVSPQPVSASMDIVPGPAVAAAPVVAGTMAPPPAPAKSAFKPYVNSAHMKLGDRPFISESLDLCFRIGFALVFIINSVTAIVQPASFKKLLEGNFLATALGHTQIMMYVIAANDALLGMLIVSGVKRKWIYAWAGAWLFIVTFVKFTSL